MVSDLKSKPCYVLQQTVGEKSFDAVMREMLSTFAGRAIDFAQFQKLAERVSKQDLKEFIDEWIYGAESSRLLVEKVAIADIVRRY